ncbi:hypothetical protein GCM10010191_19980 [Actinomadura vinacea]|uniref:Condensation domain-containing protein n=2 Tax=Actinomadura vinacea TaxID=115336 RepID=A0ABP5VWP2_9ACTN
MEPLCYGQLSVWRYLERNPRDSWAQANLTRLHRLADGVTLRDLDTAFTTLWGRYETLRTTYDDGSGGIPLQIVHDAPESVLEVLELEDGGAEEARRLVDESAARPFTFTDDFGWRHLVMVRSGRPVFLGLVAGHVVVDAWAMRHLESELRWLFRHPEAVRPTEGAIVEGPRDMAREQRSPAWKRRRAMARDHWDRVLTGELDGLVPGSAAGPLAAPADRFRAVLRLGAASGLVTALARRYRVFPQGVLLALLALGVARLDQADRHIVWVMSSNRYEPPWNGLVTSMNQRVPMSVRMDPAEPLSAFVRRVQESAVQACWNGSYDVDEMSRLALRLLGSDPDSGCLLNYAATGWPARAADDPAAIPRARVELGPSDRPAPAKLYLVVSGADTISVQAHADPAVFPEQTVRALLIGLEESLRAAFTDPRIDLASLPSWSGSQ